MAGYQRADFAGFWRRFIALIIDCFVVSLIVFPFALIVGIFSPNYILVEVPLDLFTTTTTLSSNTEESTSIQKDEFLGIWSNYYRSSETVDDDGSVSIHRQLIDPNTELSISKTTSGEIESYVIFLYWIILEASIWQASLGKKIMGLQVVNLDGSRLTIFQSAARNLLKILSIFTMFIGFMMAGWTHKKQALHDMIPGLLVIKSSPRTSGEAEPNEIANQP